MDTAKFDQKAENKKILGVLIPAILIALVWILLGAKSHTGQIDKRSSAYYGAVDFVKDKYPAVKECVPIERAAISDLGNNHWTVGMIAKGVNLYNAPIQKFVTVDMEWLGNDKWKLNQVDQW